MDGESPSVNQSEAPKDEFVLEAIDEIEVRKMFIINFLYDIFLTGFLNIGSNG